MELMRVQLRNPTRERTFSGPISITSVLRQLDLHRETVLVIRSGTLVPGDAMLEDDDVVEIRPVISGGAA
jgi:sulfur carrier protein